MPGVRKLTAAPRRARDDVAANHVRHGTLPLEAQDVLTRRAVISPDTFDKSAMTVDAVISTFSDVTRRDQRGAYVERLDPAGLDTSRLVGAPVLDGHRQASARDTIGVVTAFRTEGNALIATIRLLQSDDVLPIVERIRQGVIRGVSVGYRVQRWADTIENKVRVRTAARGRSLKFPPCRSRPIRVQPFGVRTCPKTSTKFGRMTLRPKTAPPSARLPAPLA